MIIWRWLLIVAGLLVAALAVGLRRRLPPLVNFEEREYGREHPFLKPHSVEEGLAVYAVGSGEPVLLLPYPHAHTTTPVAQGALAERLVEMGRTVITYDVPGAYRSTREPVGDMEEMIHCADETLDRLGIEGPVDVAGHSMGGLAALAYAVERPERTRRLVLVGAMSGFPAVARWGLPGSSMRAWEPDYWRLIAWGIRIKLGLGNLALHKKLQNLMGRACYYEKSRFTPLEIDTDDRHQGIPIRELLWGKNMVRGLSYADRLGSVRAPALVLVGEHDVEAPPPCSEELAGGIRDAQMVTFERSGHMPFIEEPTLFVKAVKAFLDGS